MSRGAILTIAAILVVAAGVWWWLLRPVPPGTREMEAAVATRLAGPAPRAGAGHGIERRRAWAMVRRFYKEHGGHAAWTDIDGPKPVAFEAVRLLLDSDRDGLDPTAYGAADLLAALRTTRPWWNELAIRAESLAALDVRITTAMCRCAYDLRNGRFPRGALDPDWGARPDSLGLATTLSAAASRHRLQAVFDTLPPPHPFYHALRELLAAHRAYAAAGGWPLVPDGPTLARGARGPRVAALRHRLAITGDLKGTADRDVYDAELQRAVLGFQARCGLSLTGSVGSATLAALNVPVSERIHQIELTLERMRWLPRHLPEPYILVNIPAYHLDVVNDGRDSLSMNVVVGQPKSPTPVFTDVVTYLVLNPQWTLPKRILVEEVLPAFKHDPDYFTKHELHVFFTHERVPREVPPDSVDWRTTQTDSFPFIVRQDAGPENPLGRIKFMCPNEYDVYLHDTNGRIHFRSASRDLSHGCVRVAEPESLAEYVLRGTPQASRDSVVSLLEGGAWRQIGLKRPIPVHIVYWTAWADSVGAPQFRGDLYGIDQRMAEALRGGTVGEFVLNPKVVWGDSAAAAEAALTPLPPSKPGIFGRR